MAKTLPGKVYLVGAGPGAPDLLTLRAARLLARAEIVFTDALVHPQTLALATKAEIVHVGKRAGAVSTEQRFINRALIAGAKRYATVVRLKGGDPMLFGRAQEEIEALRAAGIDFEVVPGISAAFAASAVLGVSLTQRGIARSVTFATPRIGCGEHETLAWLDAVASGGTAALYMGAGQAEAIAHALCQRGFPGTMPCAVVANASLPDERVCVTTLDALALSVQSLPPGPALIFIGDAVAVAQSGMTSDAPAEEAARPLRRVRP